MDEYLDRAEKLKAHIAKSESKKPGVIGSNGKVSAAGGKYVASTRWTCYCGADDCTRRDEDGDDPEVKKLRAGLSSKFFSS